MNAKVVEQLNKVHRVQLNFDENTTEINIAKVGNDNIEDFVRNNKYRVELQDYLLTDNPNFDFHTTWNNGIVPKDRIMDIIVLDTTPKMIKVHGYGISLGGNLTMNEWEGFLPKKSLTIKAFY